MTGDWQQRAIESWRALAARGLRVRHGGVRAVEPRIDHAELYASGATMGPGH